METPPSDIADDEEDLAADVQGNAESDTEPSQSEAVGDTDDQALDRSFLPAFDAQALARSLMPIIDTRAFLPALDAQALARSLMPIIDTQGFIRSTMPDWGALNSGLLESVVDGLKRFKPRNLRGLDGIDLDRVGTLMTEEGIPFCLVPDSETVVALLGAPNATARRSVLESRAQPIFETCEEILSLCVADGLGFLGSAIREGVSVYMAGHHRAAQALATNVLDSTLQDYASATYRDHILGKRTAPGGLKGVEFVKTLEWQSYFALAPLAQAHKGDKRPEDPLATYSRHATAHRVTPSQYSRGNAVHSIMLAVSIIGFVQGVW